MFSINIMIPQGRSTMTYDIVLRKQTKQNQVTKFVVNRSYLKYECKRLSNMEPRVGRNQSVRCARAWGVDQRFASKRAHSFSQVPSDPGKVDPRSRAKVANLPSLANHLDGL